MSWSAQHDGFKIAEADLAMRGPGEFLGTRQSGLGDFRLANLVRDAKILMEARNEAQAWLEKDPDLEQFGIVRAARSLAASLGPAAATWSGWLTRIIHWQVTIKGRAFRIEGNGPRP